MRSARGAVCIVVWVALGTVGGGCASQQGATGGAEGEPERSKEREQTRATPQARPFPELLGAAHSTEDPLPCKGEWSGVPHSQFAGEAHFCGRYPAPGEWGDVPVTVVVRQGRVAVVSVQDIFDEVEVAKARYESLTSGYLGECERTTGGERNLVLECEGWVVEALWSSNYEQAQFRFNYAESLEALGGKVAE